MPRRRMKGGAETALLTLADTDAMPLPTQQQTGATFPNAWAQTKQLMDALTAVQAVQQTVAAFLSTTRPTKEYKGEFVKSLQAIYNESTPQARDLLDEAFPISGFLGSSADGIKQPIAKARTYYKKLSKAFANVDAPTNAELQGMGCGCGTPGCTKGGARQDEINAERERLADIKARLGKRPESRAAQYKTFSKEAQAAMTLPPEIAKLSRYDARRVAYTRANQAKGSDLSALRKLWPDKQGPKLPTAKDLFPGKTSSTQLTGAEKVQLAKARKKVMDDALAALPPERAAIIKEAYATQQQNLKEKASLENLATAQKRYDETLGDIEYQQAIVEEADKANNTPMAKFMRGLTKVADFTADNLAPLIGAPGIVLATAYKNLSGYNNPDSKYYKRPAADIIKDTLSDIAELGAAKAFATASKAAAGAKGQAKAIVKEADELAKIKRPIGIEDAKLPPAVPGAPPPRPALPAPAPAPRAPTRPTSGLDEKLDEPISAAVPKAPAPPPPPPPRSAPKRGRVEEPVEPPTKRRRTGQAPETAPLPPSKPAAPVSTPGAQAKPGRSAPSLETSVVPFKPQVGTTVTVPGRRLPVRTAQPVPTPKPAPSTPAAPSAPVRRMPGAVQTPGALPTPAPAPPTAPPMDRYQRGLERLRQQKTDINVGHRGPGFRGTGKSFEEFRKEREMRLRRAIAKAEERLQIEYGELFSIKLPKASKKATEHWEGVRAFHEMRIHQLEKDIRIMKQELRGLTGGADASPPRPPRPEFREPPGAPRRRLPPPPSPPVPSPKELRLRERTGKFSKEFQKRVEQYKKELAAYNRRVPPDLRRRIGFEE